MYQLVVLNTAGLLNDFKQIAFSHGESMQFVKNMLDHILVCLDDLDMADYHLREFVAQVEFGEFNEDLGFEIDHVFAKPILTLGLDIFRQILNLGLYTSTGYLQYQYKEDTPDAFSDIVLKLTN
jgi:hypothetical protein